MPEFKLDLIADTQGFVQGLENAQDELSQLGLKAIKTGKDAQKAFETNGGAEKFQKSLKDQLVFLAKMEVELTAIEKKLKKTFDPKEVNELNAAYNEGKNILSEFGKEIESTEKKQISLTSQVRKNKDALSELAQQGLEDTVIFEELTLATEELQNQVDQTNARIKFFASNTKGLDGTIAVVKSAAAGFAVAEGAAALFGAENENVQKALLKVNAAMAILNGLQEIQVALQKSSAARLALEVIASKIKIFFLGGETVATEGLSVAQLQAAATARILRVALISLGIGVIIVAVVALANAMGAFSDSVEETNKNLEEQKQRIADLAAKYKELDDSALSRISSETELAKAELKLAGATDAELIEKDIEFLKAKRGFLKQQYLDLKGNAEAQKKVENELAILNNDILIKQIEQKESTNAGIEKLNKEQEEKEKEHLARIKAIIDGNNANRIAVMADGQNKELAQLDENQRKELIEAKKQGLDLNLLTAKFAKERTDILLKFQKQERDNLIAFDELFAQLEKEQFEDQLKTDEEVLRTRFKFIDDLEQIKLLELDIEFESGKKSIAETRRIQTEKLKVELEFAEKRLELLKTNNIDGSNDVAIKNVELAVAAGKAQMAELAKGGSNVNFLKAVGLGDITEQELQDIKSNLQTITNSIKSIFDDLNNKAIEANNKTISSLDEQIAKVQDNIERQQELRDEGAANSLETEQKTLAILEAQRQAAFERDKKLQRQKLNIDAISQASSLITASANIFQATSEAGPVGVAIAVATIAAMFAAFITSQVTARQSINQQTLGRGGMVGGKYHDADGWGGNRYVNDNGDETYIEKDEYVVNKKSTRKYRAIIEAINKDNLTGLTGLLSGTGVSMNQDRVEGFKKLKQDYAMSEIKYRIDLENKSGSKETRDFKQSFERYVNEQKKKPNISIANGYKIEIRGSRKIITKLNDR